MYIYIEKQFPKNILLLITFLTGFNDVKELNNSSSKKAKIV